MNIDDAVVVFFKIGNSMATRLLVYTRTTWKLAAVGRMEKKEEDEGLAGRSISGSRYHITDGMISLLQQWSKNGISNNDDEEEEEGQEKEESCCILFIDNLSHKINRCNNDNDNDGYDDDDDEEEEG